MLGLKACNTATWLKVNLKITIYETGEIALMVKTTALTEDLVPSTELVACNSLTLISDDIIPPFGDEGTVHTLCSHPCRKTPMHTHKANFVLR